jgi:hypothetical protein
MQWATKGEEMAPPSRKLCGSQGPSSDIRHFCSYHCQRTNYSFLGLIVLVECHPNGKPTTSCQYLQNIVVCEKGRVLVLFPVLYLGLN